MLNVDTNKHKCAQRTAKCKDQALLRITFLFDIKLHMTLGGV